VRMTADQLLGRAKELVLKDRDGARKAMKDAHAAAIEEDLDELAAEQQRAIDGQLAQEQAIANQAKAKRELKQIALAQNKAAKSFDAGCAKMEMAFIELEELNQRSVEVSNRAGVSYQKGFANRTIGLKRAIWHAAPSLAKRLKLGIVPGSSKLSKLPLADAYPKIIKET